MFIRYFVEIPRPMGEVEAELLADPHRWLEGLARDAEAQGQELLAAVGFGIDKVRVRTRVWIKFGEPIHVASRTILPMTWEPQGSAQLLPRLESDVEIAAIGLHLTQLSINARYSPPLGLVGRALDKALLHRVAEATLKDFLDRVAAAVSSPAASVGA